MNILIIGSGGREHALAWKASLSPLAEKIFVAPGNAGTANENTDKIFNVAIAANDIAGLVNFSKEHKIDLTIVGPEEPLVLGIVDAFEAENLLIFGPTKGAAQLEGSKSFTKNFLAKYNIPTAKYAVFTEVTPAIDYVQETGTPIVIKADGLAAGKGVIVAMTEQEAVDAIKNMLAGNVFGQAGHRIVIEEFLDGEEVSFIVMVDGKNVEPMATSQDHKRVGDGDIGANTGGMGAYSPAPIVTNELHNKIMDEIIYPTVANMAKEGNIYKGFLYAGLMIVNGQPKVIEFNCRFGDPETQPIMMRLNADLVELCLAACHGKLDQIHAKWETKVALAVVMVAEGYPSDYRKNDEIIGIEFNNTKDTKIFLAGVSHKENKFYTNGGRVLCVSALGNSVLEAQQKALDKIKKIHWHGAFYRKDIGYRAIARK